MSRIFMRKLNERKFFTWNEVEGKYIPPTHTFVAQTSTWKLVLHLISSFISFSQKTCCLCFHPFYIKNSISLFDEAFFIRKMKSFPFNLKPFPPTFCHPSRIKIEKIKFLFQGYLVWADELFYPPFVAEFSRDATAEGVIKFNTNCKCLPMSPYPLLSHKALKNIFLCVLR